nr:hypothetical protein [Tanacetum cinerariifolium]
MKSLFSDTSNSVPKELREKSSRCLFLVDLLRQTFEQLPTNRNTRRMWPNIEGSWPVKQGVLKTYLHQDRLNQLGSLSPLHKKLLQGLQSHLQLHQHSLHPHQGSPKSVGASEAEEVPAEEPQGAEEDADFQKAIEESLKDAYALPTGPLPPVVIREPESRNINLSQSKEESKKVVLGVKKSSQDEGQAGPDPTKGQTGSDISAQAEGQAGSNPDETSEGQAGSKPDESSEGQARPDPGNAEARVQSTSSPMVHVGSDREHMDTDVANNLKLVVEEPVLLEEPASPSGTLSSLQHLSRDFTFGDQFLCDKPSDADKSAETEVESMEHPQLKATTPDTTTTTTTTLPPPQAPQQSTTEAMMVKRMGELEHTLADLIQVSIAVSEVVTDAVDWAMQAPLRNRFRDLPEADMKEILHQRMWETDSYKSHEKKKKSRESPKMPPGSPSHQPPPPPPPAGPSGIAGAPRTSGSQVTPPPPPPPTSTNQDSPSTSSAAPSPVKTVAATEHQAWSTPDVTLKPLVSLTPEDLDLDKATGPDEQAQLSDEEDIG